MELKIKIMFKEFHIWAFLGSKCGSRLGQKWQKRLCLTGQLKRPKSPTTITNHHPNLYQEHLTDTNNQFLT